MKYFQNRIEAFKAAFSGLQAALKKEAHLKLHLLALLIVLNLGFYFQLNAYEWLGLIICCGLVISLELINSAVEALCDLVHPDTHLKIKYIKDVAAAAVLVAAVAAVLVAYLVFWPHLEMKLIN
jgi:diacylglycerol kinase